MARSGLNLAPLGAMVYRDPSQVAGYDVATGTWSADVGYDLDADQDFAETEQL